MLTGIFLILILFHGSQSTREYLSGKVFSAFILSLIFFTCLAAVSGDFNSNERNSYQSSGIFAKIFTNFLGLFTTNDSLLFLFGMLNYVN